MRTKVAYFGVLMALALILSYVESLVPISIGIPGVKLGLANLMIVIAMHKMTIKETYILSVMRVLLAGFLFGNLFSIIYSLAGAVLSLTAMTLAKKTDWFSLIGISILGGVFHNVGQLLVAAVVLESLSVGYYFSVLSIAGLVMGALIGIVSSETLKRLNRLEM